MIDKIAVKSNKKISLILIFTSLIGFSSWIITKIIRNTLAEKDLNVIIIGIDACRKDHLSCYGYNLTTTPNLSSFTNDCVLFTNAISQSPWTLPSVASFFTSCFPSVHGATSKKKLYGIRTTIPSGVEIISEFGLKTKAFVNAPNLAPELGFARGFDDYDYEVHRKADETINKAIKWIEENSEERFFLFVYLFDPHLSYAPPEQHLERLIKLSGFKYNGRLGTSFSSPPLDKVRNKEISFSDDDWTFIQLLYDAEISFVDESCGKLFNYLKEKKIYDRSIIVVMSDHGEEFRDHGGFEHGHTQYDELLNVPLMIKMPFNIKRGKIISNQVSMIDVMPTLLKMLSIRVPIIFQGESFMGLIKEGHIREERTAFSEDILYGGEIKSIRKGCFKLITTPLLDNVELYNICRDPHEQTNLCDNEKDKVIMMKKMLVSWMRFNLKLVKKLKGENLTEVDKKTIDILKSLGYIK